MNDFPSALDSLKNARRVDPTNAESTELDNEIQSVEQYLATHGKSH
jgi:hypothetical protein